VPDSVDYSAECNMASLRQTKDVHRMCQCHCNETKTNIQTQLL